MSDYMALTIIVIVFIPGTLWLKKFFDDIDRDNYKKRQSEDDNIDEIES